MEEEWLKIFASDKLYKAEIAKSVLEENNITTVIINKKDSSYIYMGLIEVYVRAEDVEKANEIIKNTSL